MTFDMDTFNEVLCTSCRGNETSLEIMGCSKKGKNLDIQTEAAMKNQLHKGVTQRRLNGVHHLATKKILYNNHT